MRFSLWTLLYETCTASCISKRATFLYRHSLQQYNREITRKKKNWSRDWHPGVPDVLAGEVALRDGLVDAGGRCEADAERHARRPKRVLARHVQGETGETQRGQFATVLFV